MISSNKYADRGVSFDKKDVHDAIKNIDKEVIHPIYIGLTHKYMVSLVDKFFNDNRLNVIENWFSFL